MCREKDDENPKRVRTRAKERSEVVSKTGMAQLPNDPPPKSWNFVGEERKRRVCQNLVVSDMKG